MFSPKNQIIFPQNQMFSPTKSSKKNGKYYCKFCELNCSRLYDFKKHLLTAKHQKAVNSGENQMFSEVFSPTAEKTPNFVVDTIDCSNNQQYNDENSEKKSRFCRQNVVDKYNCKYCNYSTNYKRDWKNHIQTRKHKKNAENLNSGNKSEKESIQIYNCEKCNKKYKNYKSFWSHKSKCNIDNKINILEDYEEVEQEIEDENLVEKREEKGLSNEMLMTAFSQMITENKELKNFVIDQAKETMKIVSKQNDALMDVVASKSIGSTNNTNIINNNQKVNINMFLNNDCRDAINLTDFIERIDVSQGDLENNAQMGFIDGISKIFLDNLKQLNYYERPIHCTDVKREIMYIKDEDTWQKDQNSTKLENAIQEVSRKSINKLSNWKETNPDYEDMNSEFSNKCLVMQQNSIAGENRNNYYQKVIKNIAKDTLLNNGQIVNSFVERKEN